MSCLPTVLAMGWVWRFTSRRCLLPLPPVRFPPVPWSRLSRGLLAGEFGVRIEDTCHVTDSGVTIPWNSRANSRAFCLTSQRTEEAHVAATNDLKNGIVLKIDGQLWAVVEFQHVKPGKGGAFVRTKLKNVLSGKVVDKTFNAGLKVETATVDKRTMQYLYRDGTDFVFMDNDTYDQILVSETVVGEGRSTCWRTKRRTLPSTRGVPLYVELPASVELIIEYTEPGLQGDRSTGGTKRKRSLKQARRSMCRSSSMSARRSKVDTRDGSYISRVNS